MKPETLEALEHSIERWKYKLKLAQEWRGEEITLGIRGCPLCALFNRISNTSRGNECIGCPVYDPEKGRKAECVGSPYEYVVRASSKYDSDPTFENAWALMEAVEREVKFLEGLLPEEMEVEICPKVERKY